MMFDRKNWLVKERVGFLKLVDTFDIYDPTTGAQIGVATEKVSILVHVLRFLVNKRLLPTYVEVREREDGRIILGIRRGVSLLHANVTVTNDAGRPIGLFKSKLFSLGGGFHVFDGAERPVAEVKGDWKGWNFSVLTPDGVEIGKVTKKWAGIGKELFTSADNYMISLNEGRAFLPESAPLLLAAGLAIDTVYKEK
jgi:uncharacterized protein YxjI